MSEEYTVEDVQNMGLMEVGQLANAIWPKLNLVLTHVLPAVSLISDADLAAVSRQLENQEAFGPLLAPSEWIQSRHNGSYDQLKKRVELLKALKRLSAGIEIEVRED